MNGCVASLRVGGDATIQLLIHGPTSQSRRFFALPAETKMLAPHPPSGTHHRGTLDVRPDSPPRSSLIHALNASYSNLSDNIGLTSLKAILRLVLRRSHSTSTTRTSSQRRVQKLQMSRRVSRVVVRTTRRCRIYGSRTGCCPDSGKRVWTCTG